jgi:UDP-2-acetamido-3-amino-2,3-dideoxy-glucuronate N-acetyltransferase
MTGELSQLTGLDEQTRKYFVHESSYVDQSSKIGDGTKIWHFCHVMKHATIGKDCVLGQNVHVGPNVVIGNRCKIQNNVSLYDGVILEDDVFCGPSMVFTNVINPRSAIERKHEFRLTLVKTSATIGANATLLCGHTIGRYAFIGAGAVVTKDVPDYALVIGNPGRMSGWMCRCGLKLRFERNQHEEGSYCKNCGAQYVKRREIVRLLDSARV